MITNHKQGVLRKLLGVKEPLLTREEKISREVDKVLKKVRSVESINGWGNEDSIKISKEGIMKVYEDGGKAESIPKIQSKVLRIYIEIMMVDRLEIYQFHIDKEKQKELKGYLDEMEELVGDHLEIGLEGSNAVESVLKRADSLFKEASKGLKLTKDDLSKVEAELGKQGYKLDRTTLNELDPKELIGKKAIGLYGVIDYRDLERYIASKEEDIKGRIKRREESKKIQEELEETHEEERERYARVRYLLMKTKGVQDELNLKVNDTGNSIVIRSRKGEIRIRVQGIKISYKDLGKVIREDELKKTRSKSILRQVQEEETKGKLRVSGYNDAQIKYIIGILEIGYDLRKKLKKVG